VRLQSRLLTFYRFAFPPRQCADDLNVFAHCPLWPDDSERYSKPHVIEKKKRLRAASNASW